MTQYIKYEITFFYIKLVFICVSCLLLIYPKITSKIFNKYFFLFEGTIITYNENVMTRIQSTFLKLLFIITLNQTPIINKMSIIYMGHIPYKWSGGATLEFSLQLYCIVESWNRGKPFWNYHTCFHNSNR